MLQSNHEGERYAQGRSTKKAAQAAFARAGHQALAQDAEGEQEAQVTQEPGSFDEDPWFPDAEWAKQANVVAKAHYGQPAVLGWGNGGEAGLESALMAPQDHYYGMFGALSDDAHPDPEHRLLEAAAKMGYHIGESQAFDDANKRTARACVEEFVRANGFDHLIPEGHDDAEYADHLKGYGVRLCRQCDGQIDSDTGNCTQCGQFAQDGGYPRHTLEDTLKLFKQRHAQGGPDVNYVSPYPDDDENFGGRQARTAGVFYRAVPTVQVESIRQQGFRPNKDGVIFLSGDPDDAIGNVMDNARLHPEYTYHPPNHPDGWKMVDPRHFTVLPVEVEGEHVTHDERGYPRVLRVTDPAQLRVLDQPVEFQYDYEDLDEAGMPRPKRQANILDPIHNGLDPRVWLNPEDSEPQLRPEHREWIVSTIYGVLEQHGYDGMDDWLSLVFTGSLTTYQYSDESDVDISLFVDTQVFPEWSRAEMVGVMVQNIDGTKLPGTPHPIQCYVVPPDIGKEDLYKPGLRSGYDLETDQWIVPPDRGRVHDVEREMNEAYTLALESADKMELLLKYEPHNAVEYWHRIHEKRRKDHQEGKGDYAASNIVYKMLFNRGLTPQIAEVSGEYIAKVGATDWDRLFRSDVPVPGPGYFFCPRCSQPLDRDLADRYFCDRCGYASEQLPDDDWRLSEVKRVAKTKRAVISKRNPRRSGGF